MLYTFTITLFITLKREFSYFSVLGFSCIPPVMTSAYTLLILLTLVSDYLTPEAMKWKGKTEGKEYLQVCF